MKHGCTNIPPSIESLLEDCGKGSYINLSERFSNLLFFRICECGHQLFAMEYFRIKGIDFTSSESISIDVNTEEVETEINKLQSVKCNCGLTWTQDKPNKWFARAETFLDQKK